MAQLASNCHGAWRIRDEQGSRQASCRQSCPQCVDVLVDSDGLWEALRLVGEAQLLWTACATVLREQVSEAVWLSSFAEASALRVDADRFVLSVPSPWGKERIESRYLDLVRAALADVGADSYAIDIEVRPDAAELLPAFDEATTTAEPLVEPVVDLEASRSAARSGDTLNPRYTFDAFVIGSSNRFAHAAA